MANKMRSVSYSFQNRKGICEIVILRLKNNISYSITKSSEFFFIYFIYSILKNLIIYMHEIYVVSNDKNFRMGFCSNYLGMLILCEARHRLRLHQFLLNVDGSIYDQLWQCLEVLESNILKPDNFNEV